MPGKKAEKPPSKAALAFLKSMARKGGKARAEALTPGRRSEIAKNAYAARKDKRPTDL